MGDCYLKTWQPGSSIYRPHVIGVVNKIYYNNYRLGHDFTGMLVQGYWHACT